MTQIWGINTFWSIISHFWHCWLWSKIPDLIAKKIKNLISEQSIFLSAFVIKKLMIVFPVSRLHHSNYQLKKHLMVSWIRTRTWLFSGLHDPKAHTDIIIQAFLIQSWAELRPVSERGFSVTDSELCSFKSSRNSGLFRINLHLKEITPSFCYSRRLERKISPD